LAWILHISCLQDFARLTKAGMKGGDFPMKQEDFLCWLKSGDWDGTIWLSEFLDSNEEALTAEDIERTRNLKVGESVYFGGGAQPEAILRRID
jgi:hypothetical protein